MPNISHDQLIDLAEGRLPPTEAAALRQAIAADAAAAAELAALEELIGLMRSDDSVDAPEHVIARAVRLLRKPVPAPAPALLERIVALLRSDSRGLPLAAGLRSEQSAPRSLSYSAGEWDLDLQIAGSAGLWQLRGQLLGPESAGSVVLKGLAGAIDAPINDLGEFNLPPVEAAAYTLLVQLGTRIIVVEGLELGP